MFVFFFLWKSLRLKKVTNFPLKQKSLREDEFTKHVYLYLITQKEWHLNDRKTFREPKSSELQSVALYEDRIMLQYIPHLPSA